MEGMALAILENLAEAVYVVDLDRRIAFWNEAATSLAGFSAEEMVGVPCQAGMLRHVDDSGTVLCHEGCPLAATALDGQRREAQFYLHHKAGHRVPVAVRTAPVRDEAGRIVGVVEAFSDRSVLDEMRRRMEQLNRLALVDDLTGIGNRRYGEAQLESRLAELARYGWPFGLLFVDVDRFKAVNDTWGHALGDQVLAAVARTLAANLRPFDVAARWGGEEFVVLLANADREWLGAVAERLRALVASSGIRRQCETLSVTVSVGATLALPSDTATTLLDRADHLLYQAKSGGRNRVVLG